MPRVWGQHYFGANTERGTIPWNATSLAGFMFVLLH